MHPDRFIEYFGSESLSAFYIPPPDLRALTVAHNKRDRERIGEVRDALFCLADQLTTFKKLDQLVSAQKLRSYFGSTPVFVQLSDGPADKIDISNESRTFIQSKLKAHKINNQLQVDEPIQLGSGLDSTCTCTASPAFFELVEDVLEETVFNIIGEIESNVFDVHSIPREVVTEGLQIQEQSHEQV
jgi:hypothetical protein